MEQSATGAAFPPDQACREQILRELDRTMLVEAAAGTGKTTSMIGRMVALLRAGRCAIDTMAAVTFTRKAAAELRARFQVELEKGAREAEGEERQRLGEAAGNVERCFIGTIHSFCARLLRERPVESRVPMGFQEMDDAVDARLRKTAWEQQVAALLARSDPALEELDRLGIEVRWLQEAFLQFCEYPDVQQWPASDVPLPDLSPARDALGEYCRHFRALGLGDDPGRDQLQRRGRQVVRQAGYVDLRQPARLMEVLERIVPLDVKEVVQKNWPGKKQQALLELDRWNDLAEKVAEPLVRLWREHRYGPVLRVFFQARDRYDQARRQAGKLNYQDLLLRAASMLRDQPSVRTYFRRRFTHLLIDEFQDTDPVQAEVMLLLTADSPTETVWRRCRPVPGSLFVVGDPKQSIYRFRRADIVTYNEVKRLIQQSGGAVVPLSANFRTTAPLVQWVNETFDRVFPQQATPYAAARRAMLVGRQDSSEGRLAGLGVLRVPKGKQETLIEHEADLVARTIRAALDGKWTVPRSAKELARGALSAATPGDFLLVARNTRHLSRYGEHLRRLGIPHQVTGGTALNEADEISLLWTCLRAVLRPDDPVALVATLRSELFGISDPQLFAFKQAGGEFCFQTDISDLPLPPPADGRSGKGRRKGGESEAGQKEGGNSEKSALTLALSQGERERGEPGLTASQRERERDEPDPQEGALTLALSQREREQGLNASQRERERSDLEPQEGALTLALSQGERERDDRPPTPIPGNRERDDLSLFQEAFSRLRRYASWLMRLPAVAAIEKIVADLGLPVLAGALPGGSGRAGILAKAIELLRQAEGDFWSASDLVEYLGQLTEQAQKHDGLPARPDETPPVRLMNLHKVKGLEAAVVFLVDPTGQHPHDVELHVDRSGSEVLGYLAVRGPRHQYQPGPLLACPQDWQRLADEEAKFCQAENDRLMYVAATRAGAQLIVTLRENKKQENYWTFFEPVLADRPPLEDPGPVDPPRSDPLVVRSEDVERAFTDLASRWSIARRPSYAAGAARHVLWSGGTTAAPATHLPGDDVSRSGEHGTERGTLIHRLLETTVARPQADLSGVAQSEAEQLGLDGAAVEDALQVVARVRSSRLWQRAQASRRCLVETPFELLLPPAPQAPPTLVRGVIDLAFEEEGGWVLVDYKTDRAAQDKVEPLVEHYRNQIENYVRAWRALSGQTVSEAGLYFTHADRYVRV